MVWVWVVSVFRIGGGVISSVSLENFGSFVRGMIMMIEVFDVDVREVW